MNEKKKKWVKKKISCKKKLTALHNKSKTKNVFFSKETKTKYLLPNALKMKRESNEQNRRKSTTSYFSQRFNRKRFFSLQFLFITFFFSVCFVYLTD